MSSLVNRPIPEQEDIANPTADAGRPIVSFKVQMQANLDAGLPVRAKFIHGLDGHIHHPNKDP